MKLLVIEDDPEIQEVISVYFEMSWPEARKVMLRGEEIKLSPTEYNLLYLLSKPAP